MDAIVEAGPPPAKRYKVSGEPSLTKGRVYAAAHQHILDTGRIPSPETLAAKLETSRLERVSELLGALAMKGELAALVAEFPPASPRQGLTPRLRDCLLTIRTFVKQEGAPPTSAEVAKLMGVPLYAARHMMTELRKRGWARRKKFSERSFILLD